MKTDPKLDLILERQVDVSPELVWKAWTEPEHLQKWFTPAPYQTVKCEIDLRPGGTFYTVMRSPEGVETENYGCYVEVVPGRKLAWTNALEAGFRPNGHESHLGFQFTAAILIEPAGKGTKYTAIVMHSTPQSRDRHAKMGFHEGWGTVLDQLVEQAKRGNFG
jgi:uncharacterized protein YndB with AHSA1/START domain